jgi:hypothetical protein
MAQLSISSDMDPLNNTALDQRIQSIAWILFLVMTASLCLFADVLPIHSLWPLVTGLILLGLNVVRAFNDIETSGFTLILGILAMSIGLGALLGAGLFLLPIFAIVIGALIISRAFRAQ